MFFFKLFGSIRIDHFLYFLTMLFFFWKFFWFIYIILYVGDLNSRILIDNVGKNVVSVLFIIVLFTVSCSWFYSKIFFFLVLFFFVTILSEYNQGMLLTK